MSIVFSLIIPFVFIFIEFICGGLYMPASREEIRIIKEYIAKIIPRRKLGYMKKKMVLSD